MFSPKDMNDEDAKDMFAATVCLIAGTYGASSVVLILESWMTLSSQGGGTLDMTPPSESYEREEVVTLIGQSKDGNCTRMYPIVRLGNGKF